MSTVNGAQSPEQQANDNSDQQVWDAAKFEAALVHLERLQEQVPIKEYNQLQRQACSLTYRSTP
jgi:hypothetical protein